ncbi:MAG: UTP--glucose-1-phosphate uridylyltransferase [Bacillota bacterium]|nr:MAG: UTP--glucose-1-phosphate uridylyltransferase [Bacillota bacterium]
MIRKAVIPAAGWGTRFLPATKVQPKELVTVVDRPAIHYVVEEAVRAGIEEIIIVTGRNKRAIEDYFDRAPELEQLLLAKGKAELLAAVQELTERAEFYFPRQREPRGLGDAVYAARRLVGDEPFAVLLPDELIPGRPSCLEEMIRQYTGGAMVAVQEVPLEEVHRYGVVKPAAGAAGPAVAGTGTPGAPGAKGGAGSVSGGAGAGGVIPVADLVEKPGVEEAPSNLAIIGRYLLPPQIFDILAELPPGRGGEVQLTDALRVLAARGKVEAFLYQGERYDVGSPLGFLEANVALALRRPELAPTFLQFLTRELQRAEAGGQVPAVEAEAG